MLWKFAERIAAQIVTFVVSIALARLLDPSHYGVVAIVTTFIAIANIFVTDGFGNALIQKKNADALDFSSVLYVDVIFSIGLYFVLFLLAPLLSNFFGQGYEILTPVTRVLGLRIILSAVNSVQQAYVSKHMMFRKFFWATLIGTVLSGIIGIIMAYMGFGVWALVAQYLTNTTVDTIVLQIVLNKWPIKQFSWERVKGLLNYGYKVLLTSLTITGFQELRALIIGKLYSSDDLAYYDKGKQFPNLIVTNINTSISAVLFPNMAAEQDNVGQLKNITRLSIRYSAYIMFPIMLGLAAVARPLVVILLTEKWLPCVTLLQTFCVFYLFQPIQTANTQAIKALGKSDILLMLEIIRDAIQLIVLLIVMWISVDAIVVSMAVMSFFFVFVNGFPNLKLLHYSFREQIADYISPLIMSLIMAILVKTVEILKFNIYLQLIIQILLGVSIYLLLSIITKSNALKYICLTLKNLLGNHK